jgi:hypothetical protein
MLPRILSCVFAALTLLALPIGSDRAQAPSAAQPAASASRELPSDAEMIAHFQAHRADFEELVRLYQTNTGHVWRHQDGKLLPFETDDYKGLLKRLGILGLSDDGTIWLPDPYSIQTAKKAWAMNLFKAYPHHGILFSTGIPRPSSRLGQLVMKGYFYVPVVPRVEDGELWWPVDRNGRVYRKARVLVSLDDYPPGWFLKPPQPRRGECVLRQFEAQWFLQLCNH